MDEPSQQTDWQQPIRLVELFGGIGAGLAAVVRNGIAVKQQYSRREQEERPRCERSLERSPRRPAFRADRVLQAPDGRGGGSAGDETGGVGSAISRGDPWRTDARDGSGGDRRYRRDTRAHPSPEEGYRRRGESDRAQAPPGGHRGRRGDLETDSEEENSPVGKMRKEGRGEGADEGSENQQRQEEDASGNHGSTAGADEADSPLADSTADESEAKANGPEGVQKEQREDDAEEDEMNGRARRKSVGSVEQGEARDRARPIRSSDAKGGAAAGSARQIRIRDAKGGAAAGSARQIRIRDAKGGAAAGSARQIRICDAKGGTVAGSACQIRIRDAKGGTAGSARQVRIRVAKGGAAAGSARPNCSRDVKDGVMAGPPCQICAGSGKEHVMRNGSRRTPVGSVEEGETSGHRRQGSIGAGRGGKNGRGKTTRRIGKVNARKGARARGTCRRRRDGTSGEARSGAGVWHIVRNEPERRGKEWREQGKGGHTEGRPEQQASPGEKVEGVRLRLLSELT
ncbi:unnamed protein product [Closterium sp. NIES-64]|nr:unnamed protein product [Closterium sp. NIES-64]